MNNMQSNFQKIIEFHKAFGLQHKEEPQTEVFDDKKLVDLAKLSLPPNSVGSPSKTNYSEVYTTTEIVVEPGYYYDPDTAIDELEISYRWYINGNLLDNNSSNILPAYTAVSGDTVSVAMVVFDGGSAIESYPINFAIEDSPIEIKIKDIPEMKDDESLDSDTVEKE